MNREPLTFSIDGEEDRSDHKANAIIRVNDVSKGYEVTGFISGMLPLQLTTTICLWICGEYAEYRITVEEHRLYQNTYRVNKSICVACSSIVAVPLACICLKVVLASTS